ncbi:uncharacterized protein L969DRAFT_43378 [Mixia osmundae IAM 14324]|uniref:DNA damage-binding protein 1 n=1 Tax=Mixia osmundae (strain CBS 9802 / IAM 14324 / JCM 22182 / KY 12970) TaxID=764103 RepID=G7E2X7_MIXOS|nr:uncharacterized protein L969DRAFT_43378 [Mixia osmundae IAM 14324]KEI42554.1 hypothetical protein L969DRAFT_43378 [Mixia osmundae IAM 14324]GAA97158.1 hypothetical protein E5Q_03834 [Mixia osmundae IAM 14324]
MLYLAHAQQPTAVHRTLKCDFLPDQSNQTTARQATTPNAIDGSPVDSGCRTGSDSTEPAQNLILSKLNRIEVHTIEPTGLRLALEIPLFGTILDLQPIRFKDRSTSSLLLLTTSLHFSVLTYEPDFLTPASGTRSLGWSNARVQDEATLSVSERAGRQSEEAQTILVDPHNRCVLLHIYCGLIRVLPIKSSAGAASKPSRRRSSAAAPVGELSSSLKKSSGKARASAAASAESDGIDVFRSYNIRLPYLNVKHIAFLPLPESSLPTIALLHTNFLGQNVLSIHAISLKDKELVNSAKPDFELVLDDETVDLFIPLERNLATGQPLGLLLVGSGQINWLPLPLLDTIASPPISPTTARRASISSVSTNASGRRSAPPSPTNTRKSKGKERASDRRVTSKVPVGIYRTYCAIDHDPSLLLVGDEEGYLVSVRIGLQGERVTSLDVVDLGKVPSPTSLTHIADEYVFVGSYYGDSSLVAIPALTSDGMECDSVSVISAMANLAPIVDFCVVTDDVGQSHLVTCSGAKNSGSLRLVRQGVGLSILATIDLPAVQNAWPLKLASSSIKHDAILVSFLDRSQLLSLCNGNLSELASPALTEPTLYAGTLGDAGAQVAICATAKAILRLSIEKPSELWTSPTGDLITAASSDGSSLLLATSSKALVLMTLSPNGIALTTTKQTISEVSCLAAWTTTTGSQIAAVASWSTNAILLYSLPHLEPVTGAELSFDHLPQSMLFQKFEDDAVHLFVGLGSGDLISFGIDAASGAVLPLSRKSVTLGKKPVLLSQCSAAGQPAVFAVTDRPTVVSRSAGRLSYASDNRRTLVAINQIDALRFEQSLMLVSPEGIQFARADGNESLHVRSLSLGELQPRKIAHSAELRAYAVLCLQETIDRSTGHLTRAGSVQFVDASDFALLDSFDLQSDEHGTALETVSLHGAAHFAVGTAFSDRTVDAREPKKGRVLTFMRDGDKFEQHVHAVLEGGVFGLCQLPNSFLAAIANAQVKVFHVTEQAHIDQMTCWAGTFLAQSISSRDSQIIVGDLYRSVVLLQWDEAKDTLSEVAREHHVNGMSAVEFLGFTDDRYIGTEQELNIFTLTKTKTRERIDILETEGMFHIGEYVTRIRKGALVPGYTDTSFGAAPQLLFGTSDGSLGVIVNCTPEVSLKLFALERNMRAVIRAFGGLEQVDWRAFRAPHRVHEPVGFVDGDMIGRFAELNETQVNQVLQGASEHSALTNTTAEDLYRLVDELQRMH